jgi:hypothetical protein
MLHLVLVGDSVFDNAAYVGGGPAVIDQVRALLAPGDRATLAAVDGSHVEDALRQLDRLPADATHLAVSAGGNDLLGQAGVLGESVRSVGEALHRLDSIRVNYEIALQALADRAAHTGLPTVLCAVYEPRSPDDRARRATRAALGLFSDSLLRVARRARLPVLDLRAVLDRDADFANPIEPSSAGGAKLATALWRVVHEHDFARPRAALYP